MTNFKWWMSRKSEQFVMWIAFNVVPKRVAYWCFIRLSVGNDGEHFPGNPGERLTGEVLQAHSSWAR